MGMATLLRLNSFNACCGTSRVYKRFMEGGDNVPYVPSYKLLGPKLDKVIGEGYFEYIQIGFKIKCN